MKIFFRILGLIIISQILTFGFLLLSYLFSVGEFSSIDNIDSKQMIGILGLKPYLFYTELVSVLIPAILFLFIFHYKENKSWVKMTLPKDRLFFMYGIMLLLLSYPLIQLSADLNKSMPFANLFSEESNYIAELMKEVLIMNSPLDLLINLILIALLPAIGEELFFRAGIQNELVAGMRNKDIAIFLTAMIFSAFHFQFEGFLPRMFLGALLGYIYYWSRSIWVSISLHFLNNAMLVFSMYYQQDKIDEMINDTTQSIPTYIIIMSLVAVFVLRAKLIEMSNSNLDILIKE